MSTTNTVIFAVSFALYSLAIIGVGIYSSRYARKSDEDYFLAGRSLGKWIAALSASASSESGWVTLGLVGLAFSSGVTAYWILPGCLLGFAFNWFVLAGKLSAKSRELGALTIPDFFAFRFRERFPILRCLSVLVIAVAMVLYVAAQFAAAGKSFNASFTGLEYWIGVLLGGAIVLAYTVSGGFRAVCWTDFLQGLLMVAALVIFPLYMLATQGGFSFVTDQLRQAGPELLRFTPDVGAMALIGFLVGHTALGINFGYPGQPHVLIRFMALESKSDAWKAGIIAIVWGAFVYAGAVTVGLMARAMVQSGVEWGSSMGDGEQSLVLAAKFMLPGVVSGLMLAAVLAAICSTADSQLVVAASAIANDLYARLFSQEKRGEHLMLNRVVVFGLGALAVLLVINKDVEVYKFVLTYGWAFLGASFGPQMILALFWKRASYAGCVAGMATGFAVAMLWPQLWNLNPDSVFATFWPAAWTEAETGVHIYNLPLAFMCALIVNVVISLLFPSPREYDQTAG